MTRPYGKHRLTDEQRKLAEDNLPLVWWFIQKRLTARKLITVNEIDDVASDLMFCLCRAAELYDPSKGKFSSYAIATLYGGFNRYRNLRDRYQGRIKLTDFVVDDGNKVIADTIPDKSYLDEPVVCWTDISKLFDHVALTNDEAHMVDLYYRERRKVVEISKQIGRTKSNVFTVLRNVRHKLANYVQQSGIPVEYFTERQIS